MKKLKKYGFFQYGQIIPNLKINGVSAPYPVLNERAIRAGAGIMLMMGLYGFGNAFFLANFTPLKTIVVLFFIDFFTKVIIGTKFSPVGYIANWIVRKQRPEYVGAIQKRFAWSLGLIMASAMFLMLFVYETSGLINLIMCGTCLTLMWFETSFGICVGCKIYFGLIKIGIISEPKHLPTCPGGACPIRK